MAIPLISLLLGPGPCKALAAGPYQDQIIELQILLPAENGTEAAVRHEPQRLVAAVLAITLGPFAAHRLYLGTDVKVPIIYGLTFGGFGVLVLIDLGHILFSKDLQAFYNNDQVFMWAKGPGASSPTPP